MRIVKSMSSRLKLKVKIRTLFNKVTGKVHPLIGSFDGIIVSVVTKFPKGENVREINIYHKLIQKLLKCEAILVTTKWEIFLLKTFFRTCGKNRQD